MLPQLIGPKRATEILMLNRAISAQDALAWGIANKIVPAQDIRDEARVLARKIADGNEGSITQTKRQISHQYVDLADRLEEERRQFVEQISKPETRESMVKFLDAM